MKLAICVDGQSSVLDMITDESVCVGPDGVEPGYVIKPEDDFIVLDGEYLDLHIRMSMYEGYEHAGSYVSDGKVWSWALLPETVEEAQLIKAEFKLTLYRIA
jgi:hypothetical protein